MRKRRELTDEEKEFIVKHHRHLSVTQIAKKLSITPVRVAEEMDARNLPRWRRRAWKNSEIKFLRENFHILTSFQIARKLGRNAESVRTAKYRFGYNGEPRIKWKPEELDYLRSHKDDLAADIAKVLGRTKNGVRNKLWKLKNDKL